MSVTPALSVILTVKLAVPAAEGFPLIMPVGDRVKPTGKTPVETLQV